MGNPAVFVPLTQLFPVLALDNSGRLRILSEQEQRLSRAAESGGNRFFGGGLFATVGAGKVHFSFHVFRFFS
jgi:hypothetical protein